VLGLARWFIRMIMVIVISQSKLLQRAGLWTWLKLWKRYSNISQILYFEVVICRWSDSSAVVSFHCCITIVVICLLNTISKSSVWNNASWKLSVYDWIRTTEVLLHNHRMRNAHMCTLAIVLATCSYRIYFWHTGGNRL